jgi:hypothetical protein
MLKNDIDGTLTLIAASLLLLGAALINLGVCL